MAGAASVPIALPLLLPDMPAPQELMPYLERMHSARHYSNFGPLVRELEQRLAQRLSAEVVTVANATQGLELVLSALELAPGSRVLVPALTFVATATAVVRAGHVPVLADVDPSSWLLTPHIAARAARELGAKAVLPVAAFGAPQDMRAWQAFEQATGLPVVVDAAGAFGNQTLQGAGGTLVFSLHATKSLPAGEGGAVVSSDAALVARVRQLSNVGITLEPGGAVPLGCLAAVGTNAKMSEYHAAVGLASLDRWDPVAARRRALFAQLRDDLDAASGDALGWQPLGPQPLTAPVMLCVRLGSAARRAQLERLCRRHGILTRRWYQPLLGEIQGRAMRWDSGPLPRARAIAQDLLGLPFFPAMDARQQALLVSVVREVYCAADAPAAAAS